MIHSKNSEKKTKQKTNQNEIAIDKVVVSVGVWHRRISYQAKVNHEVVKFIQQPFLCEIASLKEGLSGP